MAYRKDNKMKLICRKWNAKGNKTVEITPISTYENAKGVITITVNTLMWKKIRSACGKDTDFGFVNEEKKSVEIVSI